MLRSMESITEDYSLVPECRCGKGTMTVKCAGHDAVHPGHYYYKCPSNSKHEKSFMWCDEHHQGEPLNRIPRFLLGQTYTSKSKPSSTFSSTGNRTSDRTESPGFQPRLRGDIEVQVSFIFMSFVLVLLGVIIGKMI